MRFEPLGVSGLNLPGSCSKRISPSLAALSFSLLVQSHTCPRWLSSKAPLLANCLCYILLGGIKIPLKIIVFQWGGRQKGMLAPSARLELQLGKKAGLGCLFASLKGCFRVWLQVQDFPRWTWFEPESEPKFPLAINQFRDKICPKTHVSNSCWS